jgi:16S rRNA (cytidine1402-2'-O)-methyltransferase
MTGTLFVVATPIGNLEDITLRALRVLGEAQLIAAEDTRRTARLLNHFRIATPTTSLHDHNEDQKIPFLRARLEAGEHVALVSDAGTPTLSDPGSRLVAACIDAGLRVEVVPGPSAVLAALVASGLVTDQFTFVGFPPSRATDRARWLERLAEEPRPIVFFEAPHRIEATLGAALEILGDREISVARELTKLHEEYHRGLISEVLESACEWRGELTVVVAPRPVARDPRAGESVVPAMIWEEFRHLTEIEGVARREAIRRLARRHEVTARAVYSAIEQARSGPHGR